MTPITPNPSRERTTEGLDTQSPSTAASQGQPPAGQKASDEDQLAAPGCFPPINRFLGHAKSYLTSPPRQTISHLRSSTKTESERFEDAMAACRSGELPTAYRGALFLTAEHRNALAREAFSRNPVWTLRHIPGFNLTRRQVRDLKKDVDPHDLLIHHKILKLSEQEKYEALIAVAAGDLWIGLNISDFNLSLEQRLAIADLAPAWALHQFKSFEMAPDASTCSADVFRRAEEVRRRVAEYEVRGCGEIKITAYSLTQNHRFMVAMRNPGVAFKHVEAFDLNPQQWYELGKIDPDAVLISCKKLGLSREQVWTLAQQRPNSALARTEELDLTKEQLWTLARMAPSAALYYFDKMQFSRTQWWELALWEPGQAIRMVRHLDLGREQQFALAKLAPREATQHLTRLQLTPRQTAEIVASVAFDSSFAGFDRFEPCESGSSVQVYYTALCQFLIENLPKERGFDSWVANLLKKPEKKDQILRDLSTIRTIINSARSCVEQDDVKWANQQGLYECVAYLRAPERYEPMARWVLFCSYETKTRTSFAEMPRLRCAQASRFAPLISLTLAQLKTEGVEVQSFFEHIQKD